MRRPKSETTAAFRAEVAIWLRDLQQRTGLGMDAIAARGGVGKTTLYRWLNPNLSDTASNATLATLAEAFGVPPPGHRGVNLPQVAPERALAAMAPPHDSPALAAQQSWWRVNDRALELAGYLPNDVVMLDASLAPRRGDAVVAEVFNFELGARETVLRIFAPPALVTRSADPALADRADFIGQGGVAVLGPAVRMIRERTA